MIKLNDNNICKLLGAYEINTDNYIYPKIASKKNKYICTECKELLILCKGDIKKHYFRHYAKNNKCKNYNYSNESIIHKNGKLMLKSLLEQEITLSIVTHCGKCNNNIDNITYKTNNSPCDIKLEYGFVFNGFKKADVAHVYNEKLMCIFEIYNTCRTNNSNRLEPWYEFDAKEILKKGNCMFNNEIVLNCNRYRICNTCKKDYIFEHKIDDPCSYIKYILCGKIFNFNAKLNYGNNKRIIDLFYKDCRYKNVIIKTENNIMNVGIVAYEYRKKNFWKLEHDKDNWINEILEYEYETIIIFKNNESTIEIIKKIIVECTFDCCLYCHNLVGKYKKYSTLYCDTCIQNGNHYDKILKNKCFYFNSDNNINNNNVIKLFDDYCNNKNVIIKTENNIMNVGIICKKYNESYVKTFNYTNIIPDLKIIANIIKECNANYCSKCKTEIDSNYKLCYDCNYQKESLLDIKYAHKSNISEERHHRNIKELSNVEVSNIKLDNISCDSTFLNYIKKRQHTNNNELSNVKVIKKKIKNKSLVNYLINKSM